MSWKRFLLLVLSLWGGARALYAQSPVDTSKQKVDVLYSDVFEYLQAGGDTVLQKLIGSVLLQQDSIFLSCDSAIIENEVKVFALGNVLIQQGDSLNTYADTLFYNANIRTADLRGNVVLINRRQQLFTDSLKYNLQTRLATYEGGALITDGATQLSSHKGYYFLREKEVFFRDSVVVVDTAFRLRADTLRYNTQQKTVFFLGPTLITTDSSQIYCEDGYYDTDNGEALFAQRAQYRKGEQTALADSIFFEGATETYLLSGNARVAEGARITTGDRIRYREKDDAYEVEGRSYISDPPQVLQADKVNFDNQQGRGIAAGNVVWQDTSADVTVNAGIANYDNVSDYLKAYNGPRGRPLLITELEGDSFFLASDTLVAYQEVVSPQAVVDSVMSSDSLKTLVDTLVGHPLDSLPGSVAADTLGPLPDDTLTTTAPTDRLAAPADTARLLLAHSDVRIFKSDLQAICDSLAYHSVDSVFRLYYDPVMWSDTSQFSADTIYIFLKEEKIDRIELLGNAFILNSPDFVYFNQIKGRTITAFFKNEELDHMYVNGNAEVVYYALDEEDAYVGVNKSVCSEMMVYFQEQEVARIRCLVQPTSVLNPMRGTDHEALKLKGYCWRNANRPQRLEALFLPRETFFEVIPAEDCLEN